METCRAVNLNTTFLVSLDKNLIPLAQQYSNFDVLVWFDNLLIIIIIKPINYHCANRAKLKRMFYFELCTQIELERAIKRSFLQALF